MKGDVVIMPFPFSDMSTTKYRPALVLQALRHDLILLQITSVFHIDDWAIPLGPDDFSKGGLRVASLIRADRIFTSDPSLILSNAGHITEKKFAQVLENVIDLLKS
jgi:mRNA interferase MazF